MPERRCVGCGTSAPQGGLVRFVLVDGRIERDDDGRRPGRGAYLHPDAECADAARRAHAFERSFRAPVEIPDDLLELTADG
jgi:predicted RNA-binding protein YlxR (DUF448 family)